jgi:hypothetical protein
VKTSNSAGRVDGSVPLCALRADEGAPVGRAGARWYYWFCAFVPAPRCCWRPDGGAVPDEREACEEWGARGVRRLNSAVRHDATRGGAPVSKFVNRDKLSARSLRKRSAVSEQERDIVRQSLYSELEATINQRIDRYLSVKHQWLVGLHHFARASHECLLLFRDGYFTSCITLTQAVAEGIVSFVAERNNLRMADRETKQELAKRMCESGIVSQGLVSSFVQIQRSYRNDFHHMNPTVASVDLESLAVRNISDLATIEREIFDVDIGPEGAVVPKNVRYWDPRPDGTLPAYIRRH